MNILNIYNEINQFGKHMQMDYTVVHPGKVNYQMKVTEQLLATPTAAHGGAIAGFMDAVVSVAALSSVIEKGKVVSTVEFKINYLKAAFLGETLTGVGEVLKQGNRIVVAKGEIYNEKNEMIATCLATLNAYPIEKSDFV